MSGRSGTSAHAAADTHRHLAQVARGGTLGLIGAAVSAVSGFLLVLVVSNGYDPHTAGLFFTVTSAFLLLAAVATLGTETGLGRFMLRYEALGRLADIPPVIRTAFRPTLVLSLVLAVAVLVLAEPVARVIGLSGEEGVTSLRVLAVLLPFATWNALSLAGTRAFGRMSATVLVDKVFRPVAQPVLALAASVAGAGLLALTLAWALPYLVAALVSAVLFRRFLRGRGTYTHRGPSADLGALRREFWAFTWPRSITRISQMAIQRLDIILVAALRSPTEAAIYTAATRFVALGQFGTQAIQQVLEPKFTALIAAKETDSLREVYQVSAAWSMAIAWPLYVVVGSAPFAYLGLFGERYAEQGLAVVLLMSAAMLVNVATGPADTLLLMSGRSSLSLVNSLSALALDVALCLVLIPRMGLTGAAVAWAVASVTRSLLAVLQVRHTMAVTSFGRAAGLVAAASIVCVGMPLLMLSAFVPVDFVMLLLASLFCLPAYVLALWAGRHALRLTVLSGLVRRSGRAGSGVPQHEERPDVG